MSRRELPRPLHCERPGGVRRGWSLCPVLDLERGSRDSPGRWHSAGRPVLYVADSPAGALLEARAHLLAHAARLPRNFRLHELAIPARAPVATLPRAALPPRWRQRKRWSRALGDAWHASRSTAVMRVPSALVEAAWNFVLALDHPALARLRVVEGSDHRFDARLFRALPRPAPSRSM